MYTLNMYNLDVYISIIMYMIMYPLLILLSSHSECDVLLLDDIESGEYTSASNSSENVSSSSLEQRGDTLFRYNLGKSRVILNIHFIITDGGITECKHMTDIVWDWPLIWKFATSLTMDLFSIFRISFLFKIEPLIWKKPHFGKCASSLGTDL